MVNTTTTVTGNGNIPISFVVITPSLTVAYTNIHTQTVTLDSKIDPNTLPTAQTVLPSISGPVTTTLPNDQPIPNLQTAVASVLQGIASADHTLKPCLKGSTLKVQADFEVTKKPDGGIQINFIVAKIGGDVAITNDFTQTVVITFNLSGTIFIE